MKKLAMIPALLVVLAISGCESPEYMACTEKASALWDTSEDRSERQKAYWCAIERCKEKYQ